MGSRKIGRAVWRSRFDKGARLLARLLAVFGGMAKTIAAAGKEIAIERDIDGSAEVHGDMGLAELALRNGTG